MNAEDQIEALKRLLELEASTKEVSEITKALTTFFQKRNVPPWTAITSMVTLIGIYIQTVAHDNDPLREELIEKISETLRIISKM